MLGITTGEWTDEARGQEAQDSVQRQQVALVPACTYLGPAHVSLYSIAIESEEGIRMYELNSFFFLKATGPRSVPNPSSYSPIPAVLP